MVDDVFGIVGTQLGGAYLVESAVAEGGFGVVYRAQHSAFRASVALKCLKIPQGFWAAEKGDFLEQFRAEAELLFRLSATLPTVVRPLHVDAFTTARGEFVPFMALEWLEGETLDRIAERRHARGQPFTLKRLMRLLDPVAGALERAHDFPTESGRLCIVHCDLKPENIFVARSATDERVAKILDFGIGKVKGVAERVAGRTSQRGTGLASFTPAFGAPEQWAPRRYGQTGPWTDVWGLALTMVEVLAGHPIIDGDEAAMMGTALDPVRRPTPRREGVVVNDDVEAVFETALAVDPRDRYQRVQHFWGDLLRAAGDIQRRSMPPGASSPLPGNDAPAHPARLAVPDLAPPASGSARRDLAGGLSARPCPPGMRASIDPLDLELGYPGGELPVSDSNRAKSPGGLVLETTQGGLVPPPPVVSAPRWSASMRPVGQLPTSRPESFEPEQGFSRSLGRLLPGLTLAVAAIAVSVGGQAYAARTGTPLPVGWLAGALLLVGIAITVYRFLPGGSE